MLRLGFVTELLSKPIRYGYMNGIALTVLISQLPKLFGFSVDAHGPAAIALGVRARRCWRARRTSQRRWRSAPRTLAVILLLKRSKRVPGILIAVVGATIVVGAFGLEAHGVKVLGTLPHGLPAFAIPWIDR